MLGRVAELNYLNELYESEKFEFLVMYGRRRVVRQHCFKNFHNIQMQSFFLHVKKMMH